MQNSLFVIFHDRIEIEKMEPTIKDVAKLANVSIGTVDRVLHNRGRVSPENIERVKAAVKKLDYKPSQIARALVAKKSNIKIGLAYPLVESEFWSEIDAGIRRAENELLPFGVNLIIDHYASYSLDEQMASINKMVKQGISGLIFTPSGKDPFLETLSKATPTATVIDDIELPGKAFHIGPDDRGIGRLAAKLIALFIKSRGKIAVFCPFYTTSGMNVRVQGFLEKIRSDYPDICIADTCFIKGAGEKDYYINAYAQTLEVIKKNPDLQAIYIANGLTEWVAKAVEDLGKTGQIIVIGHEYTSGVKHFLENGIIGATIYQNPSQQFYLAVKLLYEIITGNHIPDGKNIVTNCNIIMDETVPFSRFGGLEYF